MHTHSLDTRHENCTTLNNNGTITIDGKQTTKGAYNIYIGKLGTSHLLPARGGGGGGYIQGCRNIFGNVLGGGGV